MHFLGKLLLVGVLILSFPIRAQYKLTILHNNDGESKLINAGSSAANFGGIARFKALLDTVRSLESAAGNAVVMLSSGDNYLAGPNFAAGLNRQNGPLYDAMALAAIDYDAICLGNHDFDFGPGVLARMVNDVNGINPTPFLSANLDFSSEPILSPLTNNGRIAKSTVVTKNGQQIGIIGATTVALPNISSPGNVAILPNVAAEVQAEVDALTLMGVNKIILIAHLQTIQEDTALVRQLHNVDVVIAGGGSELLANPGALLVPGDGPIAAPYPLLIADANNQQVPIITTPGEYKYLGRLELTFDNAGNITNINTATSNVLRVAALPEMGGVVPDAVMQTTIVDSINAYVNNLNLNVIAQSQVALDGRRPVVRGIESNLGNLVADAMLWQANQNAASFGAPVAQVALQNGGGIRNNNIIAAGNFTELNTYSILPFGNFVSIVESVTPARFKELMENCVSASKGGANSGDGRFAQVAGFSFVWDTTATSLAYDPITNALTQAGSRIWEIRLNDGTYIVHNGAVVPGAPTVNIAIADFSAKGGDQYPLSDLNFRTLGATYQQALFNYITSPSGLNGTISSADYPVSGEGRISYKMPTMANAFNLNIFHNNDGESRLVNAGGSNTQFGGVARFKTLLDTLRVQAVNDGFESIMLSSGDNFLAGPEFAAGLNRTNGPLYDAIVLGAVDYDAICLGNHDFDFGPTVLERLVNEVNAIVPTPFLSSNLDFSAEPGLNALVNNGRIAKSTVINRNGELIGVVGATTPSLANISSPGNVVVLNNVAAAVQAEVNQLTNMGVNKIILISHLQTVNEDTALAKMLTNVDVMIAGGGDDLLGDGSTLLVPGDGPIAGPYPLVKTDANGQNVYIVTTPGEYKYLGDLRLSFDNFGQVSSIGANSGIKRVAALGQTGGVASNAFLQQNVVDSVSAYVAALGNNVIAQSQVALDGRRPVVRGIESNLGNLVADAMLWQANQNAASFGVPQAHVGIQNGGGIRNNNIIAAGNFTELNTFSILPFANFVSMVENVSPERFKELVENFVSASKGGANSGDGRFAQIAGFSFVWDTTATSLKYDVATNALLQAGERIWEIRLDDGRYIVRNGAIVNNAPSVNIAIADFSANGGDQYPLGDLGFTRLGATYQQALFNYVTSPNGLNGLIDSVMYPVGGEGRIQYGGCANRGLMATVTDSSRYQVELSWNAGASNSVIVDYRLEGENTWNSLRVTNVNMRVLNNLSLGTYEWRVRDFPGNGGFSCTETFEVACPQIQFNLNVSQASISTTVRQASANINGISGGSSPYQIVLVNAMGDSTMTTGSRANFEALSAGNYMVYVSDNNGCESSSAFTVMPLNYGYVPNLVVAVQEGANAFRLRWNQVNEPNVINHQVRVRNLNNGQLVGLFTGINDTTFLAGGLNTGINYGFSVRTRYRNSGIATLSAYSVELNGTLAGGSKTDISNESQATLIYPNPAQDYVNIQLAQSALVQLMNVNGQLLASEEGKLVEFNLSQYPSGIYLLRVNNGQSIEIHKIVKP